MSKSDTAKLTMKTFELVRSLRVFLYATMMSVFPTKINDIKPKRKASRAIFSPSGGPYIWVAEQGLWQLEGCVFLPQSVSECFSSTVCTFLSYFYCIFCLFVMKSIQTLVTLSGFQLIKRRQFYLQAVTYSCPLENRKVCFFISWGGGGCGGLQQKFSWPGIHRVLSYFNALKPGAH